MISALPVDVQGIAGDCEAHGGERLRSFGSVRGDKFDRDTSDVGFLVDSSRDTAGLFHDYFELREDLKRIVRHSVDLVDAVAVAIHTLRGRPSAAPRSSMLPESPRSSVRARGRNERPYPLGRPTFRTRQSEIGRDPNDPL